MPASTAAELDAFISRAKEAGIADATVIALLRQQGWSERRSYRALSGYYSGVLGIAPPLRSSLGDNARDAFLYILNFLTLGFWTVALGQLCYVLIAHAFPDRAQPRYFMPLMEQLSWHLAAVIIALPVFLVLNWVIDREMRRRPELIDSGVRLWLTYTALLIAATIILVDAIWFLQALLQGELSVRFLLDTLVLLLLGGGVFAYYFAGLKPKQADA